MSHGVHELKFHQTAQQPHLPDLYHLKIYWMYILSPYLGYWWRYWTSVFITVHLLLCSFPNINWTSSYWLCSLSLRFWAIQLQSFHSAQTLSYYKWWHFWKCVKSLTTVKLHCIHFPPFICMPSHFVIVGNQVGQTWFALGKSLLTFLDYCLVLYMLEIDSKRTCSTIFPRTKVRPNIV